MAAGKGNRRLLAAQTENPAPVAVRTVCRQTSKVGAVCGKAARTVLCGGRSVMGVPTAINLILDRSRVRRRQAYVPIRIPSPRDVQGSAASAHSGSAAVRP